MPKGRRRENMKRINARNVMRVMMWNISDKGSRDCLEPIKQKDGTYICKFYLDFIQKTIVGIGDSKIECIDNATKEGSKLIDEYKSNNPELLEILTDPCENDYNYELTEDDEGNLDLHILPHHERTAIEA